MGEERADGDVGVALKKRRARAPSPAVEASELQRLRRDGMYLRVRINIPKAGLTQAVMEKIHDNMLRKEELVRLKFHQVLVRDMRTAHEIVERQTGGMVIWRAGNMYLPLAMKPIRKEIMTEEEAEFNSLLDSLGPRFHEWWGTGVLPVNADLLPPTIPGRNRNHQGLAAAIPKLREKSLIAKIAVKRETSTTLYCIVERTSFLPSSVAKRQELTKEIQDVEERERNRDIEASQPVGDKVPAEAGTLAGGG
ncbi:hypothetical protein DY000_02042498 [Brassica cretica]|uniref:CRM domain-containing protein n=1 Tax=Brassica cretica TaxID=69181 RepID=A0ABQ7BL87_BRACR|nr:hypothetical protein DY000_02042498 [Brassica cretica]